VITRRADVNSNPLATNFLRILGLWGLPFDRWNISVEAIAVKYIPECANNGLIAAGIVRISSRNDFVNEICVYGQEGVTIRQNNFFQKGVTVGMSDLNSLDIPASGMTGNEGLADALREGDLTPKDVALLPSIIAGLLALDEDYLPDFVNLTDTDTGADLLVITVDDKFDFTTAEEGRVYHVVCQTNKLTKLPNGATIQNIVIVADCSLSGGSGSLFTNVVLASTATGNGSKALDKAVVSLAANAILGIDDGCDSGGGVAIYSYASVHTAAGTMINGTRIVAAGDVELTAANNGVLGVAVQAGQDITLTSNSLMGLCAGGVDGDSVAWWYRLVR